MLKQIATLNQKGKEVLNKKARVYLLLDIQEKKPASYLHRTAQPHTLAIFRSWGSSAGAGRIRLAGCKYKDQK